MVQSQPRQIVCKTLSQKHPITKNWAGGVAPSEGPESKLQYYKKKVSFFTGFLFDAF
jgi:hypothetical protein